MLVSVSVTLTVYADSTIYTEGNLYYIIEDNSITIVGCFGDDEVITVPAAIAGIPVNKIAPGAFANSNATVINLPDTIMEVQEGATGGANVVFDANTDNPVEFSGVSSENTSDYPGNGIEFDPMSGPDESNEIDEYPDLNGTSASSEPENDASNGADNQTGTEISNQENSTNDTDNPEQNTGSVQGSGEEQPQPEKNSNTVIWIVVAAAVVAICAVVIVSRRKNKK